METVVELTKDNIQQIVDKSMQQIVVLCFWSEQSPQSITLLQGLTAMANSGGRFMLASVDCDKEMEIANYFQIKNVPTTLILSKGKPVDGFAGVQEQAQIAALLDKYVPAQWQLDLSQAKVLLLQQDFEPALVLLKQAYARSATAEVALVYADAQLMAGDTAAAASLLDTVGLADQDSYYHSLKAKLTLALDAADTPEIRQLQQDLALDPLNIDRVQILAKALHQAKRDEEALDLLFTLLKQDLSVANGDVKRLFLDILTALGQENTIANQYRRKLYSLLY